MQNKKNPANPKILKIRVQTNVYLVPTLCVGMPSGRSASHSGVDAERLVCIPTRERGNEAKSRESRFRQRCTR
ncbi:MAG: hypothetical protein AB7S75_24355 [Desulfococcaceae bacterium]